MAVTRPPEISGSSRITADTCVTWALIASASGKAPENGMATVAALADEKSGTSPPSCPSACPAAADFFLARASTAPL